ncbi:hypothetical protein G3O08_11645 [Cryomorpha ignava]|uniref:Lipoprotein n=1 Tax=Cryomorpha ignava TaxID=101383 RepID=A0A7K3WU17_9FLAO|nr:hypothetical protein [Cryomorpha ignava]NEN24155.1 hypothetical protein [Cryomorpha ignava]
MKKGNYIVVVILLTCGLASCFSNKYEEIGQKRVEGSENLQVKFFQLDVFEHISPIDFELLNENDSVLIHREYLTGETPMMESVDKFSPFLYDSIFYICYPYPKVLAIHHLDISKSQMPRDTLLRKLRKHDRKLIDGKK